MSVEAIFFTATETIRRGMLCEKTASGNGVAKLNAGAFLGVALNDAVVDQSVALATTPGEEIAIYADGVDELTEGGEWGASAAVPGAASGAPGTSLGAVLQAAPNELGALAKAIALGGGVGGAGGDMILAAVQTVTGAKTFGSADLIADDPLFDGDATFAADASHTIRIAPDTIAAGSNQHQLIIEGPEGHTDPGAAGGDAKLLGGAAGVGSDGNGGDIILTAGAGDGAGTRGGIDIGYNGTLGILLGGSIDNPGDGADVDPRGEWVAPIVFSTGLAAGDAAIKAASSPAGTGATVSTMGGDAAAGKGGTGRVIGGAGSTSGGDADVYGGDGTALFGGSVNIEPGIGGGGTNGAINIGTVRTAAGITLGKAATPFTVESKVRYGAATQAIADPGNAAIIPVTDNGVCMIATGAGAEGNTLAAPAFVGQLLTLCMDTDGGGDRAITVSAAFNQAGNTVITLNDAGDSVTLLGVKIGGALRWRLIVNDGATLS